MDNKPNSFLGGIKRKAQFGHLIWAAMCCNSFAAFLSVYGGIIALPLSNDLGVTRGEVMSYGLFFAVAFVIFSPIWGYLHSNKKVPIKLVMGLAICVQLICIALFATSSSLAQTYVAGFFLGMTSNGIFYIPNNVFASSWFSDRVRGRYLGSAFCFAGLAAIVLPAYMQVFISLYNWRMALWAFFIMSAVLMIPWLFIYTRTPEEKGVKPLGYRENDDVAEKVAGERLLEGMRFRRIVRHPVFYLLFFSTMLLSCNAGFENSFPAIADEGLSNTVFASDSAMIAITMLSIDGLFDLIGGLLVGTAVDKLGLRFSVLLWLGLLLLMFVGLIWFRDTPMGLYVAGACFGLHTCIRRTLIPFVTRSVFGPKDYAKTLGVVGSATGFVNGVSTALIAYTFDYTGGCELACLIGFGVALLTTVFLGSCLFFLNMYKKQGKETRL